MSICTPLLQKRRQKGREEDAEKKQVTGRQEKDTRDRHTKTKPKQAINLETEKAIQSTYFLPFLLLLVVH